MSQERSERRPKVNDETSSGLVDYLKNRSIFRGLHELGDQEMTIALESAAIRADDPFAREIAQKLRRHLMDEGDVSIFFEENPHYKNYDLSHLRPEIEGELMHLADLTPSLITVIPTEQVALPSPDDNAEVHEKSATPQVPENAVEILSEKYPKIGALLSQEQLWIENPDKPGEKFIPRKAAQDLIVQGEEGVSNIKYATVAMTQTITKEWKQIYGKDLGERIEGRGSGKYLSEGDAINLLWLLHTKLGTKGFCKSLRIDDSEPTNKAESKKKLSSFLRRK